ncbi:hypothetical protein J6P92_04905 [bacterium]|nr:hypothetical protein [bacterium]
MNAKDLFENNCLPMCWLEDEERFVSPRKDLQTLLAELEDIKNRIDELTSKEWVLAKRMKFYKEGFTTH